MFLKQFLSCSMINVVMIIPKPQQGICNNHSSAITMAVSKVELKKNQTTPLYDQHLLNDDKECTVIL